MKFLVILVCLIINYLWLKDFDRFDDSWFFRFRCKMQDLTRRATSDAAKLWVMGIGLTYAIPLIILTIILVLTSGLLFGLPLMLVHILVLLVAIDRIQPGMMATQFLQKLRAGDIAACSLYVRQELAVSDSVSLDNEPELIDYFCKQLVYRSFERMFVMFFWYMVGGPLLILFAYISYQLRDMQWSQHSEEYQQQQGEREFVSLANRVLEWIPLRLLGITFSLTGNFVHCFDNLKKSFWNVGEEPTSADLLYGYANCALSGMVHQQDDEEDSHPEQPAVSPERAVKIARIEALRALLERSQAVWLIALAIITVYSQ